MLFETVLQVVFGLRHIKGKILGGLFRPACLARVVSWFAIVVAIFMAHESGDKRGPAGGRRVRGVLDEADPLSHFNEISSLPPNLCIIFVSFHFFS